MLNLTTRRKEIIQSAKMFFIDSHFMTACHMKMALLDVRVFIHLIADTHSLLKNKTTSPIPI